MFVAHPSSRRSAPTRPRSSPTEVARRPTCATSRSRPDSVSDWFGQFNRHDIDGMLALMHTDVDFHPLRLEGLDPSYLGHDGVRGWLDEVARRENPHRVVVAEIFEVSGDRVLSAGEVIVDNRSVAPFTGLYSFDSEAIVELHHYYTPSWVLERLGLLGPGEALRPIAGEGAGLLEAGREQWA